ncbi:rhodanese-like domain-containing protein [Aureliella helgolandensis]|uniref:Thiosulfate sulfurtransferase PspE n=1 Tax=Aureliella helgolandensis TaxID=2527968 RepID=A0A518G179_9BACT|nr:rhodanese-like domain-containing protein [Aureliella helgolandensis]QDV22359.1 Thiosulfate sulfurtransferase PspE precursor [Aureliella helgolandensis]
MRLVICMCLMMLLACTSSDARQASQADAEVASSSLSNSLSSAAEDGAVASSGQAEEIVIDVRSQAEWDAGHVPQAIHIPHTEIADRIAEFTKDKQAKIVVYCAVGGRAGKAKTALMDLGYLNVENAGGYDDIKDRYQAEM